MTFKDIKAAAIKAAADEDENAESKTILYLTIFIQISAAFDYLRGTK